MRKYFMLSFILLICNLLQAQQEISLPTAKFRKGDNMEWKNPGFDDRSWSDINTKYAWEGQGYGEYDGFAWYRIHFRLPSEMRKSIYLADNLLFYLAKIDDAGEVFLNDTLIGKSGSFPSDEKGYISNYTQEQRYKVSMDAPYVRWDQENVLAVRVYDGNGLGGLFENHPCISVVDPVELSIIPVNTDYYPGECILRIKNDTQKKQNGKLQIKIVRTEDDFVVSDRTETIGLKASGEFTKTLNYTPDNRVRISLTYQDPTGKIRQTEMVPSYILTPQAFSKPQINGARIFGVRPGSPFLFKIAASGKKPMKYEVKDLPEGLSVESQTGIITGVLKKKGIYKMTFVASNNEGSAEREFTVNVGDQLALTPPMGWNSWNCWGPSITETKVRHSAQAMIDKGLIDYGWSYINVDDAWQANSRTADGILKGNHLFPDMKNLGDWLHSQGLKFGIYSSPGPKTCTAMLGSYEHEAIDAQTYADWGIDYLKYDWCYYREIFAEKKDESISAYMIPFMVMDRHLKEQKRDIIYNLCQYGMADVWQWGVAAGGNCWRTTGDIVDTWESLCDIGFVRQEKLYPYAKPGHWNDPDMLIVGKVGWGDNLQPTRLTPDEQYTHISLWSLMAAPLLIGCDISQMDAFTLNLLTNSEVLDINQDPLGKQAQKIKENGKIQIWAKKMEDGSTAVGFFNLGTSDEAYLVNWSDLGIQNVQKIRDLWRQKDVAINEKQAIRIPAHGVCLWRINKQ